jgi:hypothetical protein
MAHTTRHDETAYVVATNEVFVIERVHHYPARGFQMLMQELECGHVVEGGADKRGRISDAEALPAASRRNADRCNHPLPRNQPGGGEGERVTKEERRLVRAAYRLERDYSCCKACDADPGSCGRPLYALRQALRPYTRKGDRRRRER